MYRPAANFRFFPEKSLEPDPVSGFSVRESGRARRLSIKVYPRGKVEVVVPRRTRARDVQAFVEENRAWIDNARSTFAAEHEPEAFALPTDIILPSIDAVFTVRYQHDRSTDGVRFRSKQRQLTLTGQIDNEEMCVAALRRWLTTIARKEFEPRLRALSSSLALPYKKMQIRCQRTCWGSRSSSGTISLNLCLLFLDAALMRYLMVHELCHGRHMNHSKRFLAVGFAQ